MTSLLAPPFDSDRTEHCPACERGVLQVRFVIDDEETREGFAFIICEECRHGLSVSRVVVPANAPARSGADASADPTWIPPFDSVGMVSRR